MTLNGLVIGLEVELSWARWILSGFSSAAGPAIAAVMVVYVSDDDLRSWAHGIIDGVSTRSGT